MLKHPDRPSLVHRGNERDRGAGLGGQAVKITADTNVLVRAIMGDDERQSAAARTALADAEWSRWHYRHCVNWFGC